MRNLVYIFTFLVANIGFSQVYEAGLSYNLGNVVGERNGFRPSPITGSTENWGIILKKNMNPRMAYRFAINGIQSHYTKLTEVSGGIDFNFTNYNTVRYRSKEKGTAYVIFEATTLFYNVKEDDGRSDTKFAIALPLGLGYKKAISKNFVFSIEAKGRVALTDGLDGVTTNKSTLDAYYYVGTSLYYTFGWPRGSKNQIRF